jgi:hypothetical protein
MYTPFAGVIDVVVKLGLELPLFISFKGNRLMMFKHLAESCGMWTDLISACLFYFIIIGFCEFFFFFFFWLLG